MEKVKSKGTVKKVAPKKGRGNVIEVVIEVPFSEESLIGLADCMMNSEGMATFEIEYTAMPLFDDDEDNGDMFDEYGGPIIRGDESGNIISQDELEDFVDKLVADIDEDVQEG